MVNCQQVREDVAVAVLRGTPYDDAVRTHLDECPACREEADELASMGHVLPFAVAGAAVQADPDDRQVVHLLDRAARQRRRRRNLTWLGAAAAAVLVLVLGALGGVVVLRSVVTSNPSTIEVAGADASTGVTGSVRVTPADEGSKLAISVSGVPSGTTCALRVTNTSGDVTTVATWTASYEGTATLDAQSDVPVDQIDTLQLVDVHGGKTLLSFAAS